MWSLTKSQLLDPFDHSCVILPNLCVTLMSYVGHKKQTWTRSWPKVASFTLHTEIHSRRLKDLMQFAW